jgi:hypothetical protein
MVVTSSVPKLPKLPKERLSLTALLLRLSECYPLHHDELQVLGDLLEEKGVTDEVFAKRLRAEEVTRRLLGKGGFVP